MARIRSLKPEFWADEELACQLTRDERMLYMGLWNLADEHSRLRGDPRYIKGQLFAYDDDITPDGIEKMIGNLAALGKVHPYRAKGGRFLFLPNLGKHQRLEADKVPSRLPDPDQGEPDPGVRADEPEPGTDPSESGANKSARGADVPESSANGSALLYGTGSMEHGSGNRSPRAPAQEAPPTATPLASQLLDEHTGLVKPRPPRDVTRRTGVQIDKLLDDPGITPDEIRGALALLRSKPNAGPGLLPDFVHEVRQRKAGNGAPPRGSPGKKTNYTDEEYASGW